MEIHDIRTLAEIMRETGLTSLEYSENGAAVKMSRGGAGSSGSVYSAEASYGTQETFAPTDNGRSHTVTSPMVGVFYAAPGEDLEPFVRVGDEVAAGDVLCIIEAMKMMNEITADKSGVISEICASNKQIVEFGSPLFRISPEA